MTKHLDRMKQDGREQTMSSRGLSKARLDRMHGVMAGIVERGEVPGLVSLVSRRGEVHVDTIGTDVGRLDRIGTAIVCGAAGQDRA